MSTLKIEHISHLDNGTPDLSIDSSGHLNIVNGNLQMGGVTMLDTNVGAPLPLAGGTLTGHVNGTTFGTNLPTPVSIGGTPADLNTAEVGPGYINLARDDTADAAQIRFAKNGSLHSYIETSTNGLRFITDVGDISLQGGNVGIGDANPSNLLSVEGSSSGNFISIIKNTHNSNGSGLKVMGGDDANTTAFRVTDYGNNSLVEVQGGGNVGIGDDSPSSRLTVKKNSSRTTDVENMVKIDHTSSGTTGVGFGSAIYFLGERENGVTQAMGRLIYQAEVNSGTDISSGFIVQTATAGAASDKLRVTHNGNVGIGETSTAKLGNNLGTLLNVNNANIIGNGNGGCYFNYNARYNGSWLRQETSGVGIISITNSGKFTYRTADSDTAGTEPSLTEIIRTGDNGQPSYVTLDGSDQVRLTLGDEGTPGTNNSNWIRSNVGQLGLNAAHDNIHFEIGGSPKMKLDSSSLNLPGNYAYNNVDGFQVNYPTGRIQLGFNYNSFGAEIILGNNRTASGETAFMQYRTNGVNEGSLVGNGSGLSISNVSDYRKKENITELASGSLTKIANVRPVTYTLREEYTNDTSKVYTGFIAHEFQEQFPNSVRGVKDELNEDGSVKLQSIDITSNELLTHLIKSIQELKTENDALKARVTSLEE